MARDGSRVTVNINETDRSKSVPRENDSELRELYGRHLEAHRYEHTDVWRGQQYYTTINIAIIGAALAIVRLQGVEPPSTLGVIPLPLIGMAVSILGYDTIGRLRRNYKATLRQVLDVESALGYSATARARDGAIGRIGVEEHRRESEDPDHVLMGDGREGRLTSITGNFRALQILFFASNLTLVIAALFGLL